MRNHKTAIIIVGSILLLSILFYFIPINSIIGSLPIIKRFYNNTTLEIVLQNGKAKIWINGKEYGETPQEIEDLKEGEYIIELEKIASGETFYKKQTFKIPLYKNTSSRIDLEIGPEDILHGSIIYYSPEPKISNSEGFLTATSNADNAKLYVDGEYLENLPITEVKLQENQYQVKISALGYEDVEIPLIIRKGYLLNLKAFNFPIPVNFDNVEDTNE